MFLHRNRATLKELGVDFYTGLFQPNNHVELHVAAMRFERASGFKQRSGLNVDEAFRSNVTRRVRQYISQSPCRCIVFSNEAISLLRYPDEMHRLRQMVPSGRIEIVLYLRNPKDFVRSYSLQLRKNPLTLPKVIDKDSFAYLEADSWLLDFEGRVNSFRDVFGAENVTVVDYDHEVQTHGNVIPSFLRIIGIEPTFGEREWKNLFLNRSSSTPSPTDG
ncbi:MAG TPA: hypothetical protein VD839_17090 [Burkholderiales bacterium]|nr:hypothetical protein [Burkholderiales bacterium]